MIRSAVLLLCAVVAAVGLIYFEGPGLARDIALRNETLVPAQASVTGASCKTHWWIYSRCEVSYRVQQAQQPKLHYSFLGRVPEKAFRLVRPASNPQLVMADIGMSHLGNRISLFVLGLVAFAAVGFLSLRRIATA